MHRERRVDDVRTDGAPIENQANRADLENLALALCSELQRPHVRLMSDRQLQELSLRQLAPSFSCAGRSDDGVRAGFEQALRHYAEQLRLQRAADQRAQRPDYDQFFRDQGVLAQGQRVDDITFNQRRIDARINELESARYNAWRPKQPVTPPTAERDFDAELRELEQRRRNAWRGPSAT